MELMTSLAGIMIIVLVVFLGIVTGTVLGNSIYNNAKYLNLKKKTNEVNKERLSKVQSNKGVIKYIKIGKYKGYSKVNLKEIVLDGNNTISIDTKDYNKDFINQLEVGKEIEYKEYIKQKVILNPTEGIDSTYKVVEDKVLEIVKVV